MSTPSVAEPPLRVLYFAGAGRSGGTILCHILGQQPGYFYAGELRDLWTRGLTEEKMCGCGKRVVDCDVWQAVFRRAYGGIENVDTARMAELRENHSRTRQFGAALRMRMTGRPTPAQRLYLDRLDALYRAIREVTGCRVIVDASRLISYGLFVSALPGIDLRIVQLVRDPRAVAFSWTRKRVARTATREHSLRTQGAGRSALDWTVQNAVGELLWRRVAMAWLTIRYEDIVANPVLGLGRISAMMGDEKLDVSFLNQKTLDLRPNHSVAGNAYRTQTGPVTLAIDDEWRTALTPRARRLTTMLCLPGLVRYRYGLRAGT